VELTEPRKALQQAGAETVVMSLKAGSNQGMNHDEKADMMLIDEALSDASATQFDGLVLPGGVANPDTLHVE
jgi:protease I